MASAKAVDADKYAPYWYTLAVEYLHKAREEAADSDFQAANRFGRKAEEAAENAKSIALRQAGRPVPARLDRRREPVEDAEPASLAPLVPDDDEEEEEEEPETAPEQENDDDDEDDEDDEVPPGLGGTR